MLLLTQVQRTRSYFAFRMLSWVFGILRNPTQRRWRRYSPCLVSTEPPPSIEPSLSVCSHDCLDLQRRAHFLSRSVDRQWSWTPGGMVAHSKRAWPRQKSPKDQSQWVLAYRTYPMSSLL